MEDNEKETSSFLASLGVNDDPITSSKSIVIDNDTGKEIVEATEEDPDLDQSVNSDFTLARANIIEMTQVAKDAITKLAAIADQSQHPRAFEVLGGLIKTVMDAQQDIFTLHKKREELKPGSAAKDDVPTAPGKITNNLFVGSTAELQKIFTEMNKNG
jgi:hypothetical protein